MFATIPENPPPQRISLRCAKYPDKSKLIFTNEKIDGVVKGDIDKSGKVDLDDLMICLEHVAEQKLLTGESFIRADID